MSELRYYSVKVTDGRTGRVSVVKIAARSETEARDKALAKCAVRVVVTKLGIGAALVKS